MTKKRKVRKIKLLHHVHSKSSTKQQTLNHLKICHYFAVKDIFYQFQQQNEHSKRYDAAQNVNFPIFVFLTRTRAHTPDSNAASAFFVPINGVLKRIQEKEDEENINKYTKKTQLLLLTNECREP